MLTKFRQNLLPLVNFDGIVLRFLQIGAKVHQSPEKIKNSGMQY